MSRITLMWNILTYGWKCYKWLKAEQKHLSQP